MSCDISCFTKIITFTEYPGGEGPNQPLTSWFFDGDTSFKYHIDFRDGSLVIPRTGRYLVYSQVYFREVLSAKTDDQPAAPILSHYVTRANVAYYSNNGKQIMLSHHKSTCWSVNKPSFEYTSYVSGIFNLRKGDEVIVSVSNIKSVHSDPTSTFFGLVKL